MNLQKAQNILWSLLAEQEKQKHMAVYQLAVYNLSNGVNETVVNHIKVVNNAPAALYFEKDETLPNQPNIVGKCLNNGEKMVVAFQSSDIIELLELYFSKENLLKQLGDK